MTIRFWCFDCFSGLAHNDSWGREVAQAAILRGHKATMFRNQGEVGGAGYWFARRRQFPPLYEADERHLGSLWANRQYLHFVQDRQQWLCYEDKIRQYRLFSEWMPRTWYCPSAEAAYRALDQCWFPLVSKASVGSSSVNVRILADAEAAQQEIDLAFSGGLPMRHGAQDARQTGYLLWQQFIPHQVTWRVTAVGTKRHAYRRFCYPDKAVAAPAAVVATEPAAMSDEVESLLDFSNRFFEFAGTQWCAIDVLKADPGWRLLETSLAWARGGDSAGNASFYGTEYSLNTQAQLLVSEIEQGAFG